MSRWSPGTYYLLQFIQLTPSHSLCVCVAVALLVRVLVDAGVDVRDGVAALDIKGGLVAGTLGVAEMDTDAVLERLAVDVVVVVSIGLDDSTGVFEGGINVVEAEADKLIDGFVDRLGSAVFLLVRVPEGVMEGVAETVISVDLWMKTVG